MGGLEGLDLELDRDERLEPPVEQEQVDEEVLPPHLDAELLAHEAEVASELEQELLEVRHEGSLEIALRVVVRQVEEVEEVAVLEDRRDVRVACPERGRERGLADQGPLEERPRDLAFELPARPALLRGEPQVERALLRRLAPGQDEQVGRPRKLTLSVA
jgi:hypothetical protein